MKINNLKINGFGKLENKEINLSENINLIYGKNEAGKTTLLKFISGMFYGVSKNKNKKEIPDFERYKPWKAGEYSGKINYTLDNNNEYEIFRDFTKKNPQIYNNKGEDISKNFNIDKTKGNEFFYEQTKIDETMFLSTTLVEQKNVVLDNNEQGVLTQKIANILSTGEENISYKKTIDKLNKRLVEEVGNERTVGRPLNIVCDKLEKIEKEQQNLEENSNLKNELENKRNNLKNKIKEENNLENEKIKINKNLKEQEITKINELENKIEKNKIKKEEKNKINLIIILLLFIINIILFIFNKNKIINYTIISISFIFIIYTIIKIIKNNKKIKEKNKTEKNYLDEIKLIEENIKKIQKNIDDINNLKYKNEIKRKNEIKEKYIDLIEADDIDSLLDMNIIEANKNIEELEKEISGFKLQIYTNEVDYNNIIRKEEEKAKIEENLQGLLEEKEELLKLNKVINIVKENLENAYKKMKEEITPKFTKNLSTIVEKISNKKYNKTKYVDGEGLIVELENGEYINANKLSIGTIDQLYLSLRLSAMQEITEEKMPIILDETFAYYDNERLASILKYLSQFYNKNQIIIFTCSNREKEILETNNIKYNYVEL